MKIGDKLLKKLRKTYEPERMLHQRFERYDISFKTDSEGNPVLLFIGTRGPDNQIHGERFTRVLVRDRDGKVIKDYWDAKGKT